MCVQPVLHFVRLKPNQNSLLEWRDIFEKKLEALCTPAMSPSESYKDRYKEHGMLVIELFFLFFLLHKSTFIW